MPLSCPLRFTTLEPCARRGEPVTVGLPWPRGTVADERRFQLVGPGGSAEPLQTKVLDRWPDGSVRWCLFDFLATWDGKQTDRVLVPRDSILFAGTPSGFNKPTERAYPSFSNSTRVVARTGNPQIIWNAPGQSRL